MIRRNGDRLAKAITKSQYRIAFAKLVYLPGVMSQPFEHLNRRRASVAFNVWKQYSKLLAFMEKRQGSQLEEMFEAWKHIVAFKGGHSIHNKALKQKVLAILVRRKKLAKVKQYMIRKATDHRA